jgi:site-specific recombinase XerD
MVEQWLAWLERDRGRTANTLATYRRTMRTLPQPPEMATIDQIEAWWRSRSDLAKTSRNNELSAVVGFYKWLNRFDHREDNPTRRLDQLKVGNRVSRFVVKDDLERLLTNLSPELRRAVALGAYGGMRVSEVAAVDWRNVNLEARRIYVLSKGDKERSVGLGYALLDIIGPPMTAGNVVTRQETGYTAQWLQVKVNRALKAQGVQETFHKLRHRYGYEAARAGIPLPSIARAMGHESTTQTLKYIAAVDSDLDLIAEAVAR